MIVKHTFVPNAIHSAGSRSSKIVFTIEGGTSSTGIRMPVRGL